MAFAPDGRIFICEQEGQLRVIKNGVLLPTPFVTLNVNFVEERGLVGVVLDPAFASNKYVYVYYTATTPTLHNRVSRFTANGDVALGGSEQIILDLDDLGVSGIHNGGAMRFGNDGKLYVAVGENNIPAYAQSFSNMLGKLLRINKDGTIPTDNPFYNSAAGKNRAIYALGFRNPFNFDIQSTTGRIFINEVGGSAWEEINDILPGRNYGWPTTEGATTDPRFTTPTFAYPHGEGPTDGCAVTGGAFYNPSTAMFPSQYVGKYFFTDYCGGWIRMLDPATKTASTFASDLPPYPVNLTVGPEGALYYISHGHGAVYKITSSSQVAPSITRQPASLTRSVGQSATFEVGASGSGTLTYQWQRNNVNISGATSATYTISAVASGDNNAQFRCIVGNSFGSVTSNNATLTVSANRAPVAAITAPAINTLFSGGQLINYAGTGTDAEDGTLPATAFTWRVDFHHVDHVHPFLPNTSGAKSGSFTAGERGEPAANVWYRIHLTVRDAQGVTHSVFQDVQPRTVQITLQSVPAGLKVNLDSQPQSTPATFTAVVGVIRSIEAFTQTLNGKTYTFKSWADGGIATREITTPTINTTYTATYEENSTPPPPINSALTITNPVNGEQLDALNAVTGSVNITSLQRVDLVITRSDGQQWNGTAWVAPDTGIATIINGTNWSTNGTQLPKGVNLPVGDYVLKAVAFDTANNVTVSAFTTVTIMTQATGGPNTVAAIITPANGATLSTLDGVSGSVSAAAGTSLQRVDLVITRADGRRWNGSVWVVEETGILTTVNGNAWSATSTQLPKGTNLPAGVYELKVVAFDTAGNVGVGINSITISPAISLTAFTLNPTSVVGGAASTGTLTVSAPAPDDTVISLSSSNASVASVPSTITVPMGARTVNFTISTPTRTSAASAVITATFSGASKTATLNVTSSSAPPPPPVVRPDALIKLSSEADSSYAIDNTYQSTPASTQSKSQSVAYGVKATYQIKIQNDGTSVQSFVVKALESAESGWTGFTKSVLP